MGYGRLLMPGKPKVPKQVHLVDIVSDSPAVLAAIDEEKKNPIELQAEWANGPRTPAWENLWRGLLAELLQPADKQPDAENHDGHV